MAIFYDVTTSPSSNQFLTQSFQFYGDGVSTDISIDLSASPIGLVFVGHNFPALLSNSSTSQPATITLNGPVVKFSFSTPPASIPGVGATGTVNFAYAGR